MTMDLMAVFTASGPGVLVLVALASAHVALCLGQVVWARTVDLAPLLWAGVAVTVVAAGLLHQCTLAETYGLIAVAGADKKVVLEALGTATALRLMAAGLLLATVQALAAGVAHSVRRTVAFSGTWAASSLPSG